MHYIIVPTDKNLHLGKNQCTLGYNRVILLIQNPYELIWRKMREINNAHFERTEQGVAFLTMDQVKNIQNMILNISGASIM